MAGGDCVIHMMDLETGAFTVSAPGVGEISQGGPFSLSGFLKILLKIWINVDNLTSRSYQEQKVRSTHEAPIKLIYC